MRFFWQKAETRCTICKREKKRAIHEQVSKMEICGVEHCLFREEITESIREFVKPELIKFELSKEDVLEGEEIQVFWETANCRKITVVAYGTYTESFGTIDIVINETQEIILQIEDVIGTIYESKKAVRSYKKPLFNINTFKTPIKENENVLLSWEVQNHERVILKNNHNEIIRNFVYEREFSTPNLTETTIYTFEIVGKFGFTISKTVTIQVIGKITINDFSASRYFTVETMPITLSWQVENANQIAINGLGDVSNTTSIVVNPNCRTVYTLTASNEFYRISASIVIEYLPMPRIREIVLPQSPVLNTSLYNFYGNYENTNTVLHNLFPKPIKHISKLISIFPYLYSPFDKLLNLLKRKQSNLFKKLITQYSNYDRTS